MGKTKSNGDNYIYAYYQGIKDGTFVVSRYIRLLYERIVSDLQDKAYFFDAKKANNAIGWIEGHCFHTEGPLAPGPLRLELWQKAAISCIFGLVDDKGLRVFREVLLLIGRKNGKSLFASAVGNYTFQVDGGYGTKVYCLAPKLEQSAIIYDGIWNMIQLDPEYQALKELTNEKDMHNKRIHDDSMLVKHRRSDIYITGTNSMVKRIAFAEKRSDGFNPSLTICDEAASWPAGERGLKQYEVMRSGMGARPEALMLTCTTSGYVNDSIFDELMKRSSRYLLGESKERKLLPFLYMIDDVEKWNDINELRKANPNLGVSIPVDYMLEEIAIAEGSLSKRTEFLCKYACIKQNSSTALLPAEVVKKACGDPIRLEDFQDSYCVLGLDLSQTIDLSAAVCLIERGGEMYCIAHFWLPAGKIDEATQRDGVPYSAYIKRGFLTPSGDNFIDYHDVYDWIVALIEQYSLYPLKLGYDRYSANYLIQALQNYGIHTDDVYQGEQLYGIITYCCGLLADGKLHIGDNDLMKMHLLNSALKMSTERGRGKLIKLSPKLHIDGMAALIDALTVRDKYYAEIGEQLQNN